MLLHLISAYWKFSCIFYMFNKKLYAACSVFRALHYINVCEIAAKMGEIRAAVWHWNQLAADVLYCLLMWSHSWFFKLIGRSIIMIIWIHSVKSSILSQQPMTLALNNSTSPTACTGSTGGPHLYIWRATILSIYLCVSSGLAPSHVSYSYW